jgi:hypothetical protein
MKRRQLRIVAMALFCILTLTSSASAECAWVLWVESAGAFDGSDHTRTVALPWNLVQATSSQRDCERVLSEKMHDNLRPGPRVTAKKVSDNVVFMTLEATDGRVTTGLLRYVCLPDTVDPRGPKGK